MSRITKIEQQQKRKNRVNLYLDGEFTTGLYKDTLIEYNLYEGKEISREQLNKIEEGEEINRAKEKVRNYLSYRQRSTREVRDYLRSKGFTSKIIERIIDDFKEANLLNDEEFAELWVKDRSKRNPKGNFALRMELKNKGIKGSLIDKVLGKVNEKDNIMKSAEKAFRKYNNREDCREKIISYLARRGFPQTMILDTVDEILSGK